MTLQILDFGFWILDFLGYNPHRGWKNLQYSLRCVCYPLSAAMSQALRQPKIPKPRTQGVVGVNQKDAPASLTLRYRKSKIQNCVDF
ncbi:hypothetical protein CLI64_09630 [Nostoc sp. CENA543]|nr:hypothetical protein CLI64_09630 [Nostoc sp. CENA543]